MNSAPQPPVIVTPPPSTAIPAGYMIGGGIVTILAGALQVIEPQWTSAQDMNVATFGLMALGGLHMLVAWWLAWRYPNAPPLP